MSQRPADFGGKSASYEEGGRGGIPQESSGWKMMLTSH